MPKKKVGQRLADGSMLDLGYTLNDDEISQIKEIPNKVPKTRKINNKELNEDITLTPEDIGVTQSIIDLEKGTINASDLEDGVYRIPAGSIYKWKGTSGVCRVSYDSILTISTNTNDSTRNSILLHGNEILVGNSSDSGSSMKKLITTNDLVTYFYPDFQMIFNTGSMREDWQNRTFYACGREIWFKRRNNNNDYRFTTNRYDLLYIGNLNENGELDFVLFQQDGVIVGYGADRDDVPTPKKILYKDIVTKDDLPSDYLSFNAQTLTDEQKTQARANIGAGTSDFSGDYNDLNNIPTGHITKDVDNLTNYTLSVDEASKISLVMDNSTYVLTVKLLNSKDEELSSSTVDFPLESMVVSATYLNDTKEIQLTLKNGTSTKFSVADLVSGLATSQELANVEAKIPTDYVPNTDPVYEEMSKHYSRTLNMADLSFDYNNWWSSIRTYYPMLDNGKDPYENFYYNSFESRIYPYASCIILEKGKTYSMAFDTRLNAYPTIASSGDSLESNGFFFREIKFTGRHIFTPTSGLISSLVQIVPINPYFQITTDTNVKHFEMSFVAEYNMILESMEFHFHVPNVSVSMNPGGPIYTGKFVFNEGSTPMTYKESHGRLAYTSQIPNMSGYISTGVNMETKKGSLELKNTSNGVSLFVNSARLYADTDSNLRISSPSSKTITFRPGGHSVSTYGVKMGIEGIIPETNNSISLGNSSYKFKNLYLYNGIYNSSSSLIKLPSSAGTLALTKDIKVTSVNGQTGDVTINAGVTSVNGQTGDVTIQEHDLSGFAKTSDLPTLDYHATGAKQLKNIWLDYEMDLNTGPSKTKSLIFEDIEGNSYSVNVATKLKKVTSENDGYMTKEDKQKLDTNVATLSASQTFTGVKTFSNGVKVGSAKMTYDSTNKCLKFTFD